MPEHGTASLLRDREREQEDEDMTLPPKEWSAKDLADARIIKAKIDGLRRDAKNGTGGRWSDWCGAIIPALESLKVDGEAGTFARIVAEKFDGIPSAYDSLDATIDLIVFVNHVVGVDDYDMGAEPDEEERAIF